MIRIPQKILALGAIALVLGIGAVSVGAQAHAMSANNPTAVAEQKQTADTESNDGNVKEQNEKTETNTQSAQEKNEPTTGGVDTDTVQEETQQ